MKHGDQEGAGGAEPPPRIPGYALARLIGQGGYGQVWLARREGQGEAASSGCVALKTVRRSRESGNTNSFEQERRGVRAVAGLGRGHPGLAAILDHGVTADEEFLYYAMEPADSVPGSEFRVSSSSGGDPPDSSFDIRHLELYRPRTLASELAAHGRLPVATVVAWGRTLAAGLGELHRAGLAHRDIKPSNVVFIRGQPCLADCGLVKPVDESLSAGGTIGFMPPEGSGTPSGDIYSLGLTLWCLATGARPGDPAMLALPAGAEAWSEHGALLELDELKKRACAFEPRRRTTAAQLLNDLNWLHEGKSLRRRRWRRLAMTWAVAALLATLVAYIIGTRMTESRRRAREAVERSMLLAEGRALRSDLVLRARAAGWASNAWARAAAATRIALSSDAVAEAAATLQALDVRLFFGDVPGPGASALEFDPAGGRLLLGGVKDGKMPAPTRLWHAGERRWENYPFTNHGPVAWAADGTPVQLSWHSNGPSLDVATNGMQKRGLDWPPSLRGRGGTTSSRPMALTPDASYCAAGVALEAGGGMWCVWDSDKPAPLLFSETAAGALAFSPDGRWLAVGDDEGRVSLRSLPECSEAAAYQASPGLVTALAFAPSPVVHRTTKAGPDWLLAVGASGGRISMLELANGRQREFAARTFQQVEVLAFNRDASILAMGQRRGIHLYDAATGIELLRLDQDNMENLGSVAAMKFSPDDRWLITAGDRWGFKGTHTAVFELEWSRGVRALHGLDGPVGRVIWSPDGRYVAGRAQTWRLGVWEWPSGRLLRVFETPQGVMPETSAWTFTVDGTRLAFVTGSEAVVWELPSGRPWKRCSLPSGLGDSLVATTDGHLWLLRRETSRTNTFHMVVRDLMAPAPERPVWVDAATSRGATMASHGRYFAVYSAVTDGTNRRPTLRIFATSSFTQIGMVQAAHRREGHPTVSFSSSGEHALFDDVYYQMPDGKSLGTNGTLGKITWEAAWVKSHPAGHPRPELLGAIQPGTLSSGAGPASEAEISPDHRHAAWGTEAGVVFVADMAEVWRRLERLGRR